MARILGILTRWLQFAFINSKGNVNKTALKLPCAGSLEVDEEVIFAFGEIGPYNFTCVAKEQKTNNDGTVDETYIIATNNQ